MVNISLIIGDDWAALSRCITKLIRVCLALASISSLVPLDTIRIVTTGRHDARNPTIKAWCTTTPVVYVMSAIRPPWRKLRAAAELIVPGAVGTLGALKAGLPSKWRSKSMPSNLEVLSSGENDQLE